MAFEIEKKWYLFGAVTAVGFAVDIFTKHLAVVKLTEGIPVNVLGRFAQFVLVFNKAAIWGIDPRKLLPWFPLNGFFMFFTIAAVVLIVMYYASLKGSEVLMQWGISLIMPGALGNLWDRVIHGNKGVVDFVRLGVSENLYWAIFNMADAYVTIGVALMLINFILEDKKRKLQCRPPAATGAP